MELNLKNPEFCLFILTQFPFASNDELDMNLDEYIFDSFEMPAKEWFDELTGKTDENGDEIEPWEGYTYVHKINNNITLYIEFHPSESIYFFNDTYLGNTGGNFQLSLLAWNELLKIVAKTKEKKKQSLLFLLLLPLVIGNESEKQEIKSMITDHLKQTSLNLKDKHLENITEFLCNHLVFEDNMQNILEFKNEVGFITNRNHSERNHKKTQEELIEINEIIELATQ